MSVINHPSDKVRKGERIYLRFHLVTSGLCIPKHEHLVGPAVVSIQESGAGDEKCMGAQLVRAHAKLQQEMGRPTGSEEEHKRYLPQCIQIYFSNYPVIMGRN